MVSPEIHAEIISTTAKQLIKQKYMAGQLEHGGHLLEMSNEKILNNAIDEAIDQLVYLLTLKEKIK